MKPLRSLLRKRRTFENGLILSGGGARGFAHAGILKALEEKDIYPDVVSGVSAGAIVGALYADGHSPDEIYRMFSEEENFFNFVRIKVPGMGLMKAEGLSDTLSKHMRSESFEELKIPLIVAATDMTEGVIRYFQSGSILDKVLASASIPVLFEPVEIDGHLYVDGGVLDNFPVTPLAKKCRRLYGASLNPIHPEEEFDNLFRVAERTFRLSVSSNISPKISLCDKVFEPKDLGKYQLLDTSAGEEMFELGYETAKEALTS